MRASDDWLVCKSLNLDIVVERPFTTISMEKQQENLKLMQDADIVLIADVPFGLGNVNNLKGLEALDAEIYLHANCLNNDFTEGRLEACLNKIREKKTVVEHRRPRRVSGNASATLEIGILGRLCYEYFYAGGSQQ